MIFLKRALVVSLLSVVCFTLLIGLFCGCSKKTPQPEYSVLVKMLADQKNFFKENILESFEKVKSCKFSIITFEDMSQLEMPLELEKVKDKKSIMIVKVPFEMVRPLVEKGYILPLEDIVGKDKLEMDIAKYHQLALGLGYFNDGKLYYIPRKLETRILFVIKSKVGDALKGWKQYEKELNSVLKKQNGYGLPKNYMLEDDPNLWDMYDIFVMGYFWSKTDYFGVKMPRIAHRGKKYEGTALDLVERAIGQGATESDFLKMDCEPIIRMYEWESIFKANNLYNPGMWEEMWDGSAIYNGIKDGKVFLSFVQQIDCFNIHGWQEYMSMPGYLANPDDMCLALMPKQVSFELNKDGSYVYEGTKKVTTGGWWWGIPKTCPNPKLAYDLILFITNKDNQARECARYGMLPVRKDILNNLADAFELGWVGDIFRISVKQIDENELTTVPLIREYSDLAKNYIDAWYDIVIGDNYGKKGGSVSTSHIRSVISRKYVEAQKKILGNKYPN